MKIAGLIAEFNPFHSGHEWHIKKLRERLGADTALLCVMSGNFVQRGDFAIFAKHSRAEAAVRCGADLVLELPLPWAMASAQNFARGAVSLLDSTGIVTHLSFGSEAGDLEKLQRLASALKEPKIPALIQKSLKTGISYPAACMQALENLVGDEAAALRTPNNILAVEYLQALSVLDSRIEPLTIPRVGAGHDTEKARFGFASAHTIRTMLKNGEEPWDYLPNPAQTIFKRQMELGFAPTLAACCESAFMAKLRTMDAYEFDCLPDAGEGLGRRLMKCSRLASGVEETIIMTKTKRYTHARIRRLVLSAFLGVTAEDTAVAPPYFRILAFNDKGRSLLSGIRERSSLPIITKPSAALGFSGSTGKLFRLEVKAGDLYALAYPSPQNRKGGSELTRSPVYCVTVP